MVRDPITRLYRIEQWDLVFKNNKLIGWKYVTGDSSSSVGDRGVGFLCNDAIARGDELAIRVHCK